MSKEQKCFQPLESSQSAQQLLRTATKVTLFMNLQRNLEIEMRRTWPFSLLCRKQGCKVVLKQIKLFTNAWQIFLKVPRPGGGQTWDLLVLVYFLSKSSALDHLATAPHCAWQIFCITSLNNSGWVQLTYFSFFCTIQICSAGVGNTEIRTQVS